MNPSIHYVTQSGLFKSQKGKMLTNRRIGFYRKQGYYASPLAKALHVEKVVKKKRQAIKNMFLGL